MSKTAATDELVEKFKKEILRGLVFTDDVNIEREKRNYVRAKSCAIISLQSTIDCLKGLTKLDEWMTNTISITINLHLECKISEIESQIKELHK